ncbi:hypothetical protein, partial [Thiolapillus sp.]|uniref:hypothetical protein n=1 Tax=Thiolapillus sp. TaxID=2017437 RepID=UPI003AF4C5A3
MEVNGIGKPLFIAEASAANLDHFRLFDVSYGFQYGTRRAGNHVDHSYKSSVVSIASGSCSGC